VLIRKLKILSLAVLLSFVFSGCSQKPKVVTVFKDRNVCFKQSIFGKPKLDIYVANEDIEQAEDFKTINDSSHAKYINQVNRNNERCERLEDVQ
jgi:hypothetical protein